MWHAYIADTMTGQLDVPLDLPSFRWSVSVSDCSMSTTRDKGTAADDATGLQLPWGAVPADTPEGREGMLASSRRSIALCWDGTPVVFGAIGARTDTWQDASFDLVSPMQLLGSRYVVHEGVYGRGTTVSDEGETKGQTLHSVTTDSIHWSGLSLRAIACRAIQVAVSKPGGSLPIDLPYLGEEGTHERTYDGFNVQNLSCRDVLEKIADVSGGPDISIVPYMADQSHVRLRVVAGSDSQPLLGSSGPVPTLTAFPGGGTLQDLRASYAGPTMRVYGYGSGRDKAQYGHLSEDLALCRQQDPWPLVEAVAGFTSDKTPELLAQHTDARLAASKRPLCQLQGKVRLGEGLGPSVLWPGYAADLQLWGFPSLPDGTYHLRLMELSGDEGADATATFDVMANPWY